MKRILSLIMVMMLVISLVACGGESTSEENKEVDSSESVDNRTEDESDDGTNEANEESEEESEDADEANEADEDSEDDSDSDVDEVSEDDSDSDRDEEVVEDNGASEDITIKGLETLSEYVTFDRSLTGMELLDSVEFHDNDFYNTVTMHVAGSFTSISGEEEMVFEIEVYASELKTYTSFIMGDVKNITISLTEGDVLKEYSYNEGDAEGTVYEETLTYDDEEELPSIYDVYDPDFGTLIDAHVDTLDGYEVIYIEYEDGGYVTKLWFMPALGDSIKEENYLNGELVGSSVFTTIELFNGSNLDVFKLPANVTFIEE